VTYTRVYTVRAVTYILYLINVCLACILHSVLCVIQPSYCYEGKGKGVCSSSCETYQLQGVTCHVGSQCYLPPNNWMHCVFTPARQPILNLPLLAGWKARLTWVAWLWQYTHYPLKVTHSSTNRAQCRVTSLIETSALPLSQTTTFQ